MISSFNDLKISCLPLTWIDLVKVHYQGCYIPVSLKIELNILQRLL